MELRAESLADFIKAHYTKYEFNIPMRDGVKLFTQVFVPKDASKPYPFLLNRTPYAVGPYGVDNYPATLGPSEKFAREGYIFVRQDVRGRYLSEGSFVEMTPAIDHPAGPKQVDESTDTSDTLDWLLKNIPNNNGRAGIYGISYPGFYTIASSLNAHPALVAASPQAPMMDLYMNDDAYHNGCFMLAANFGFYVFFKVRAEPERPGKGEERFQFGTEDGYDFYLRMGSLVNGDERYLKRKNHYWTDQVEHSTYDQWWKDRAVAPHIHHIGPSLLTVGGWFDAEDLQGPLTLFETVNERSPDTENRIVMGPWVHGGWARSDGSKLGVVNFNANTSEFFRDEIQFPFFEQKLKGKGDNKLPKAYMFETGTDQWMKFDSWPPANVAPQTFYLTPGGRLSGAATSAADTYSEYLSDPNKPVPFTEHTDIEVPQDYMDADQRFAARRPDVLVFETEPLDHDVVFAGPINIKLHVSTSGTDSDFDAKLIDVYPSDYPDPEPNPTGVHMGGYQQLVRGEPFRGKFRKSFEHPAAFQPGVPDWVNYPMPDILHSFRRGHRIMVQVQSSWFPLTDRNPQVFGDIANAKSTDFKKAIERVYSDSRIEVGVLP
jgi:putative CocE/NonD family hydrolase